MVQYSLVVPVYNEEECLPDLFREIQNTMSTVGTYELVLVDDCSSDSSPSILKSFQSHFPNVAKIVTLDKRMGQTSAMRKGLEVSIGEYAVTLDADLQNDPADIPKMVEKIDEGYDCVCGWRKSRQDTPLKAGLSKLGNILQRLITGLSIHDVSCTLRIYKRECVKNIPLNWEGQHRFIPLSLSLQGYKIGEVVSNHRKRRYGVTKYSHKRIFRVVVDFFRILKSGGKQ